MLSYDSLSLRFKNDLVNYYRSPHVYLFVSINLNNKEIFLKNLKDHLIFAEREIESLTFLDYIEHSNVISLHENVDYMR